MLYHLFQYLEEHTKLAGAGLFEFLSFRAALSILVSLIISLLLGGKLIRFLKGQQVKETVRKLGLEGEKQKQGTPTMGGLIILGAVLIPVLLLADLSNVYIQLMLFVTVTLGGVGFTDDYIKVFKKNKGGLSAYFKLIGQCLVGLVLGAVLFFHPDVIVREDITRNPNKVFVGEVERFELNTDEGKRLMVDYKTPVTTIPMIKDVEFDYSWPLSWMGGDYHKWAWLIFIPIVTFILTFISNGVNLTDGIDGLATGTTAIVVATLGILAYVTGNIVTSNYLNILYLPNAGELLVFCAALLGACVGFLWYNAYPAQVFMGDTGSLALGGMVACLAIIIRKELLIPILCGIFIIENISVIMQVGWFKYTKKRYGEGRRIFKMAPLHHHYQKLGMAEPKLVARFWIIGILLAVLTFIVGLKIR